MRKNRLSILRHNPSSLVIFCFICLFCNYALYFLFAQINSALIFNQSNRHVWQFVTAHFVHYDWQHLNLNMLALPFLLYIFPVKTKVLIQAMSLAMVLIAVYLRLNADIYCGFSALLYVIIGLGFRQIFDKQQFFQFGLAVLLLGLYFVLAQDTFNATNGIIWKSAKHVHLLGFLVGFFTQSIFLDSYNKCNSS